MTMHKLIFIILFFCGAVQCNGQEVEKIFGDAEDSVYDENEHQAEIKPDTVLIRNTSYVPVDSILHLKQRKDFAYVPILDSLLKKQSSPGISKLDRPLSLVEKFINSAFFRFFIWLIPVALVLIVLYNLLNSRGVFRKKKENNVHEDGEEYLQDENHDYLRLANEAAGAGNFRAAVKYLFLRTLQQLSGAALINYASDKTNYNYVQEISSDKKKEFARLVLNYEYVWYGNISPDKSMYADIENEFASFFKKYNLS